VFADALAPIAEAASGVLSSRHPATITRHRDFMRAAPSRRFSAMVIVLRNRKVNGLSRLRGKPSKIRDCGISPPLAPLSRLHPVHREP